MTSSATLQQTKGAAHTTGPGARGPFEKSGQIPGEEKRAKGKKSRVRRAMKVLSILVVAFLMMESVSILVMGSEDFVRPPTANYGVYEELQDIQDEMSAHADSPEMLNRTAKRLEESVDDLGSRELDPVHIRTSPEPILETRNRTVDGMMVEEAPLREPHIPPIFGTVENNEHTNATFNVIDTVLGDPTKYWIYTEYYTETGERLEKWTSATLRPSLFDPDQGIKTDTWNGVNIDYDTNTGDADNDQFLFWDNYEEGSDLYVRLWPTIPALEDLLDHWYNPFYIRDELLKMYEAGIITLNAGLKVEVKKDSEWLTSGRDQNLTLAIVKSIGYSDEEEKGIDYIWMAQFNFTDTPMDYVFNIETETLQLNLNNFTGSLLDFVMDLLLGAGGGDSVVVDVAPPYTIRYDLAHTNAMGNSPADSIDYHSILIGYDRLEKRAGQTGYDVTDRTWCDLLMTPDSVTNPGYIPRALHARIFGEKDYDLQVTNYDQIAYYANIPTDLRVRYGENKQNDTYVVMNGKHMPGGDLDEIFSDTYAEDPLDYNLNYKSLHVLMEDLSQGGHNYTIISYNATGSMGSIEMEGFQYTGGYSPGSGHAADYYHLSTEDPPTDLVLEGTFKLESAEDPFTEGFNNVSLSYINGFVNNLMIYAASSLYAVGNKLRSIPENLNGVVSDGGNMQVKLEAKVLDVDGKFTGYENYSLGPSKLVFAQGCLDEQQYPSYVDVEEARRNDVYFMGAYTNLAIDDPDQRVSISTEIAGLESAYFSGEMKDGALEDVFIRLNTSVGRPLEVCYLEGIGTDYRDGDYVKIRISDIPRKLKLRYENNITVIDFMDQDSKAVTIGSIDYRSDVNGMYVEALIEHIPHHLSLMYNDTITMVDTISSYEDEESVTHPDEYFDFRFAVTNETDRNGSYVFYNRGWNNISMHKSLRPGAVDPGEPGSLVSSISGEFRGIKKLRYEDSGDGITHVELRLTTYDENTNLTVVAEDEVDYDDPTRGINALVVIGPLPGYLKLDVKKVDTGKSVKELNPDISGLADIEAFIDSYGDFVQSLMDLVDLGINEALKGVGIEDSSDWTFDFSTLDPVTGEYLSMSVFMELRKGNVDYMYDHTDYQRARWVHGISARQLIMEEQDWKHGTTRAGDSGDDGTNDCVSSVRSGAPAGNVNVRGAVRGTGKNSARRAIIDAKVYIEGLPAGGSIDLESSGEYLEANISITRFAPQNYDWLLVDVRGIRDTDLLIFMDGLKRPLDISISTLLEFNTTRGDEYLKLKLSSEITRNGRHRSGLDKLYFEVLRDSEENYNHLVLQVPSPPPLVDLDLFIKKDVDLKYTADNDESTGVMKYVILSYTQGDASRLPHLSEWVHGISLRSMALEDERIQDVKLYFEGVPEKSDISIHTVQNETVISMDVDEYRPNPDLDWLLMDIHGIDDKNITLYITDLNWMSLKAGIRIRSVPDRNDIFALIDYDNNIELGRMYLNYRDPNLADPVVLEMMLSSIPERVHANISVSGAVRIRFDAFDALSGINYLFAKISRLVDGVWYDMVIIAHGVPTYLSASIEPNKELDVSMPVVLQGNPDITFIGRNTLAEVFISMDGMINHARGKTTIHVVDVTNNTRIWLDDNAVYKIRSPDGVTSAFIMLEDLPVMKNFHMERLEIYAEDIYSVDIEVKMLFGLYPVFKLSETDGGFVQVKMKQQLILGDREIDLSAAVVDAQFKGHSPYLAPVFVNRIATTLGTDHFIIPEPVTTVIATILGILFG